MGRWPAHKPAANAWAARGRLATAHTAHQRPSNASPYASFNHVSGEVLLGDLHRAGFAVVDDAADADAIVVNTCGFVEDAKAESVDAILAAASMKAGGDGGGKARTVVVTGCLAQRYAADLAESLPEADLVVGFEAYASLPATLRSALGLQALPGADEAAPGGRVQVGAATVPFRPEGGRHRLTPRHTAYLRVAEGCSHKCTFCAIPSFRRVGFGGGGLRGVGVCGGLTGWGGGVCRPVPPAHPVPPPPPLWRRRFTHTAPRDWRPIWAPPAAPTPSATPLVPALAPCPPLLTRRSLRWRRRASR